MTGSVRIARNIQYRDLVDEAVLLHLETGECFALDAVANRIWQLLVELGDLERVVAAVSSEYSVASDVLEAELTLFVDELRRRELIEP